jgi:ABC-type bacteriocin/lantibiotic exporter with double-glycine peptidase domain
MELEEQPLEADGEPQKLDDKGGVKIENLTFQYNPEENSKKVLNNFSYSFPPGSCTAILGETGSGKTTLIRLMLALLHPTSGRITVYNDHQEFEVNALTRCNFVYVPQGNSLFSGTIRENMLMGRPDATEDDIRTALGYACADFVYKLKDGLDTRCSEKGGGLSEGQAQRIAIARALLRRGSILLLDEATSALDLETEKNLLQRLTQGEHGKTLIFVTHRLAVMEYCNQTLKIENRKE